jgi:hypothetical protein
MHTPYPLAYTRNIPSLAPTLQGHTFLCTPSWFHLAAKKQGPHYVVVYRRGAEGDGGNHRPSLLRVFPTY